MASALLRVFGSVDALAVEACVLRCSVSLAHHLSAMRTVLDKVVYAERGTTVGVLKTETFELGCWYA